MSIVLKNILGESCKLTTVKLLPAYTSSLRPHIYVGSNIAIPTFCVLETSLQCVGIIMNSICHVGLHMYTISRFDTIVHLFV